MTKSTTQYIWRKDLKRHNKCKLSRTAGKDLSPYNSMLLMKAIFNAILSYGTEMLPISSNCFLKFLLINLKSYKEEL